MALTAESLAADLQRDPDAFIDERDRRRVQAFSRRMVPGYIGGDHIDRLTTALEAVERGEITRLIVTIPPRHSKSIHVSENFPAWYLGRHPDQRIIAASHTAQLAYTFSRRVRNKIADPHYPFGVTVADDKGAVQAWDTDAGGGYIAVGAGGSPTGHGGNGIVIDDALRSAADAESQTVRDGLWEWYQGTMRTRLQPGGWIIVCQTRWHEDDLTGRLLQEAEHGGEHWHHIHMPAIDEAGAALWPEFWPLDDLAKIRQSVGSRVWESQYQGRPSPMEGGMFKRHWWQRYGALPATIRRAEITVDSAFKTGVKNDYSVFALWVSDGAGSVYLVRIWRDRVAFPDLIQLGHDAHTWAQTQFPHLTIPLVVEDKASGQSAIQTWTQPYYTRAGMLPALPVVAHPVPAGQSKEARADGVTPTVEGGRAFVPEQAEWVAGFIEEHAAFPNGAHDDQCFVAGTMVATVRGQRPIETIKPGDHVITPFGPRRVVLAGCTGVRPVVHRAGLTGTANHPVFTYDRGFIPLIDVQDDSAIDILSIGGMITWQFRKRLNSRVWSIGASHAAGTTSARPARMPDGVVQRVFMSRFGRIITGLRSPQGMKSTIKTRIRSIMTSRILNAYRLGSIESCIAKAIDQSDNSYTSTRSGHWPLRGIAAMPAVIGIAKMHNDLGANGNRRSSRALSAVRRLMRIARMQGIAQRDARRDTDHEREQSGRNSAPARFAAQALRRLFRHKKIASRKHVVDHAEANSVSVAPVYNLSVDGDPVYYANGVLVHNCDTTSIALTRLTFGADVAPVVAPVSMEQVNRWNLEG